MRIGYSPQIAWKIAMKYLARPEIASCIEHRLKAKRRQQVQSKRQALMTLKALAAADPSLSSALGPTLQAQMARLKRLGTPMRRHTHSRRRERC